MSHMRLRLCPGDELGRKYGLIPPSSASTSSPKQLGRRGLIHCHHCEWKANVHKGLDKPDVKCPNCGAKLCYSDDAVVSKEGRIDPPDAAFHTTLDELVRWKP